MDFFFSFFFLFLGTRFNAKEICIRGDEYKVVCLLNVAVFSNNNNNNRGHFFSAHITVMVGWA